MESLNADNERIMLETSGTKEMSLKEARDMKNKIINEAKDQLNSEAEKILLIAKEEQITNEKIEGLLRALKTLCRPIN